MNFITGENLQCLCDISIITPDTFQFHTNIAFKTPILLTIFKEKELKEKIKILNNCKSIFVYTHYLDYFFNYIYPYIDNNFILVTHNSDHHITARYLPYLLENKIIKWYSQNINILHNKLIPLPIGIANSQWKHGDLNILQKVIDIEVEKTKLLYINFNINTNFNHRKKIFELFKEKKIGTFEKNKSFENYLISLKKHKFCLVPSGNGIDCHRTWECLYLGVIPIVDKHPHNIKLSKIYPMLLVEDWNIITEDYLNEYYSNNLFPSVIPELSLSYYNKLINNH